MVIAPEELKSAAHQAENAVVQVEREFVQWLRYLQLRSKNSAQEKAPKLKFVAEQDQTIDAYAEREMNAWIEPQALPGRDFERLAGQDDFKVLDQQNEPLQLTGTNPPLIAQSVSYPSLPPGERDPATGQGDAVIDVESIARDPATGQGDAVIDVESIAIDQADADVEAVPILSEDSNPIVRIQIGETVIEQPFSNLQLELEKLPPEQSQELANALEIAEVQTLELERKDSPIDLQVGGAIIFHRSEAGVIERNDIAAMTLQSKTGVQAQSPVEVEAIPEQEIEIERNETAIPRPTVDPRSADSGIQQAVDTTVQLENAIIQLLRRVLLWLRNNSNKEKSEVATYQDEAVEAKREPAENAEIELKVLPGNDVARLSGIDERLAIHGRSEPLRLPEATPFLIAGTASHSSLLPGDRTLEDVAHRDDAAVHQSSDPIVRIQIGETVIEQPFSKLRTELDLLPPEQAQELANAIVPLLPNATIEQSHRTELEACNFTGNSSLIDIRFDGETKFHRTESGNVEKNDFAAITPRPQQQLQARPPAEVEAITGQELGSDSALHGDVIRQAPIVIVSSNDFGQEIVTSSIAAPVDATEDTVETEVLLEQENSEIQEEQQMDALLPPVELLDLGADDHALFSDLQSFFEQSGVKELQPESETITIRPQEHGFIAQNGDGQTFEWSGKSAQSNFAPEQFAQLQAIAIEVPRAYADFAIANSTIDQIHHERER